MSPEAVLAEHGRFLAIDGQRGDKPPPIVLRPEIFKWRDPSTIPRRQFVYGRCLIRGFLSVIVAPGGVGKSSLSIVEALAMASGQGLIGVSVRRPLRVWYVNLEDPREEIERRVAAACLHYDLGPDDLGDRLAINGRETDLILAEQTKTGTKLAVPVEDALTAALTDGQYDVLILDPFVSTHRVPENDNNAVDAVAKTLAKIAGKADCAISLVHHVRKTGTAEITAEDGRGASALVAAARSVRVINRMTEDEAAKAGVGDEFRSYFRCDDGKANLAPASTKANWYRLQSVSLENGAPDTPFDDADHVGVVTRWKWPDAFEGVTGNTVEAVLAEVRQGRWRENSQAKDWVGQAVARALGLDASNRCHAAKIKLLLKTWIANGTLVVVEDKDENRETRKFVQAGA